MFGSHPVFVHFILLCLSYLRYISKTEEIYVGNFHLSICQRCHQSPGLTPVESLLRSENDNMWSKRLALNTNYRG